MVGYRSPPYFYIDVRNATVVAIDPDPETGSLYFAVVVAGNKIARSDCQVTSINGSPSVSLCKLSGATLWFQVQVNTWINDSTTNENLIGKGPETLSDYIKVGEALPRIGFAFTKEVGAIATSEQIDLNRSSWKRLTASIGLELPRSDRRFMFFPGLIDVLDR